MPVSVKTISDEERRTNTRGQRKVTTSGSILEVMDIEHRNTKATVRKLSAEHYCLARDYDEQSGEVVGEIYQYNRTENRSQNYKGMRQSMKKLRDLINCNVLDPTHCRWVTLTYAENMTDHVRLTKDHEAFMKRLRRYHEKRNLPKFKYILAVEPQGRGAWHIHTLWIYPERAPYLPNEDIRKVWGHGFVTVKKLDDVDNVGAYLTAYLCDVEEGEARQLGITGSFEEKEVTVESNGQTVTKKYLKGARLNMYPSGMNFYRCSSDVLRPTVEWLDAVEAKEKASAATLTFSKTIRIEDETFSNDIHYEYYNFKRKQSQPK